MSEELKPEQQEALLQITEERKRIPQLALIGAFWWIASAGAVGFSLSKANQSILWYGGILVGLHFWRRAYNTYADSRDMGLHKYTGTERNVFVGTCVTVLISLLVIVPELIKVEFPKVGTCWAELASEGIVPIACWSSEAKYKTVDLVEDEADCYSEFVSDFVRNGKFTCLDPLT